MQLAGHTVELLAQVLKFVARAHIDPVRKLTATDAGGPRVQRLDRTPDLPREGETGDHRDEHAQQHEQAGAKNGSAEGRERLGQRLLDEDRPAERRDDGVRHQRVASRKIGGQHGLRGAIAGGPDMRLGRKIGLAQDEADVGMRDEMALLIDHVRLAQAADADLRDDVPDELQIDLGGGDGRRDRRPMRHGQIRAPAAGPGPSPHVRPAGNVGAAGHHVHGQTGHAQLLAPAPVEEGDLGDRGHLPEQADVVDLPLLQGAGNRHHLGLRRPTHLVLDLTHELLDP